MNKVSLQKTIAETAYNVGYAAKVNFATFDMIEKVPGLLGFVSLVVGILALYLDSFATKHVGALMATIGIISLYLSNHQQSKDQYEKAGKELTDQFNKLKKLYRTAESRSDDADMSDLEAEHDEIQRTTVYTSLSKQVLFSDWFAHYKFFWQQQIDWIDEQKHFSFWRDKVPLTAWLALIAVASFGLYFTLS